MKVYITRYALTRGIEEIEVKPNDEKSVRTKDFEYFYKPDWHETLEDAFAQAKVMVNKKELSLKKQLRNLDKLRAKAMRVHKKG